jgi:hypothetical protein
MMIYYILIFILLISLGSIARVFVYYSQVRKLKKEVARERKIYKDGLILEKKQEQRRIDMDNNPNAYFRLVEKNK